MGGFKKYNPQGGFSEYLYREDGAPISIDGMTVKIITGRDDYTHHTALPAYANTSVAYAKRSDSGDHAVEQLRIYVNRKAAIDFDWNHAHMQCKKGVVHVHIAPQEGPLHSRPEQVRYMNNSEMARYGKIIKALNPKAKFRP